MTKLKQVSVVFHQYETGVRSGTIKPGVTKYEINFVRCAKNFAKTLQKNLQKLCKNHPRHDQRGVSSAYTLGHCVENFFCPILSKIIFWNDQQSKTQNHLPLWTGGLQKDSHVVALKDKKVISHFVSFKKDKTVVLCPLKKFFFLIKQLSVSFTLVQIICHAQPDWLCSKMA